VHRQHFWHLPGHPAQTGKLNKLIPTKEEKKKKKKKKKNLPLIKNFKT
jgi:hypothetical protein